MKKNQSYSEKLKDPRWQKKRLEILQRDNFECQMCGDTISSLNVHHISYNGDPWETESKLLLTLCEECHNEEKEKLKVARAISDALQASTSLMANQLAKEIGQAFQGGGGGQPGFSVVTLDMNKSKDALASTWQNLVQK
jgi:alanyl-tRNA synthetase